MNKDGLYLNDEQLHKLLCLLDSTIISKEAVKDDQDRNNLWDFLEDLSWDIADRFGYDLFKGTIDPHTYQFKEFEKHE